MKKLLVILIAFVMVAPLGAAEQTTLPSSPSIPSMVIALAAGSIILPLATLTGTKDKLCSGMGGTYVPNSVGLDQCPNGQWSVLFGIGTPK